MRQTVALMYCGEMLNSFLGQLAQLVRASRLHREGQRFESSIAHKDSFGNLMFFSR